MPEAEKTAETWRKIVRDTIKEELYLCAVNNFVKDIDPGTIGFDATVQFPLDFHPECRIDPSGFASLNGFSQEDLMGHWIIDYAAMAKHITGLEKPAYTFFRGVFPAWDNTPRRQKTSAIFINSDPEIYKHFLKATLALTRREHKGDEQLVFINAWNEWAEGAHLEPDQKYGLRWLTATKAAFEDPAGFDNAREELLQVCERYSAKVPGSEGSLPDTGGCFETPLPSEIDIITNSMTFRVGRIIMWFPIRLYNLLKKFRIINNEA